MRMCKIFFKNCRRKISIFKIINHFRCDPLKNYVNDRRFHSVHSIHNKVLIDKATQEDIVQMGAIPITKVAPFIELNDKDDWKLPLAWEVNDSLDRDDCIEDAHNLIELYLKVAGKIKEAPQVVRDTLSEIYQQVRPIENGECYPSRTLVHRKLKFVLDRLRAMTLGQFELTVFILSEVRKYLLTFRQN